MENSWRIQEQEKLLLNRIIEFYDDCGVEGSTWSLLGKMSMSKEAIKQIEAVVLEVLRKDPIHGPTRLAQKTPAHLAIFLVWQGIKGYQDGDYWSAVHEATGIMDKQLETRCGRAFLDFLNHHNLPTVVDVGGYKYVTPILLHGGIPDSCLPEYFRK